MLVHGNKVIANQVFESKERASEAFDEMVANIASTPEKARPVVLLEDKSLTRTETFGSHALALESAQAPGVKARAKKAEAERKAEKDPTENKAAAEKKAAAEEKAKAAQPTSETRTRQSRDQKTSTETKGAK